MIMNREIKFRGKSINSGKWVYAILHGFGMDWFDECVIESSIGQFTGLYDRNGKEIYEGDILRSVEYHNIVGYIMYDKEEGAFMFINIDELMNTELVNRCHITERWLNEFPKEVIGNIYDNKELLEE